jgi:hypothetical protein
MYFLPIRRVLQVALLAVEVYKVPNLLSVLPCNKLLPVYDDESVRLYRIEIFRWSSAHDCALIKLLALVDFHLGEPL